MALVKIEGSELELPDDICKSDKTLRDALVQFYPGAANSDVKREKKGDREVITVTKRAGSKGSLDPVVAALDAAPEWIHPALRYDVSGWRMSEAEALELALLEGLEALVEVERIAGTLDSAAALASAETPEGF